MLDLMKTAKGIVLIFVVLCSWHSRAQKTDKPWTAEVKLSDTLLLNHKLERAQQLQRSHLDSNLILTSQCEKRGRMLLAKYKKGTVNRRLAFLVKEAMNSRALSLTFNDELHLGAEEFKRGLAHENQFDLGGQAHICNNIAYCLSLQFKYGEAVEFTERSINYSKAILNPTQKETTVLLHSYNSLASIYRKLHDYDKTLYYLKKCEELIPLMGSSKSIPVTYSFLARVYLKHFSDTLNSRKYYTKTLESIKTIPTPRNEVLAYIGLSELTCKDSIEVAENYLNKAGKILDNHHFWSESCLYLFVRSRLAFAQKNIDRAISYGEECLKRCKGKFSLTRARACKLLELCYKEKGDWEKVYAYTKIVKRISDSSLNLENQKQALEMKSKWDFLRYQAKVKHQRRTSLRKIHSLNAAQQKNGRLLLWCIVGIALLSLFSAFGYIVFKRKLRNKEAVAERELKSLLSEINLLRAKMNTKLKEEIDLNTETLNQNLEYVMKTSLSKREMDVLLELCKGKENKEIAASLFISVNTVRTHLLKIYNKMDVKNRSQAINKANNLNQM